MRREGYMATDFAPCRHFRVSHYHVADRHRQVPRPLVVCIRNWSDCLQMVAWMQRSVLTGHFQERPSLQNMQRSSRKPSDTAYGFFGRAAYEVDDTVAAGLTSKLAFHSKIQCGVLVTAAPSTAFIPNLHQPALFMKCRIGETTS